MPWPDDVTDCRDGLTEDSSNDDADAAHPTSGEPGVFVDYHKGVTGGGSDVDAADTLGVVATPAVPTTTAARKNRYFLHPCEFKVELGDDGSQNVYLYGGPSARRIRAPH